MQKNVIRNLTVMFGVVVASTSCSEFSDMFDQAPSVSNDRQYLAVSSTAAPLVSRSSHAQGYFDVPAGVSGPGKIVIDRPKQQAFFYMGDTVVGITPIASGKNGFDTPPGNYKVIQMDANYKSGTYGVFKNKATGQTVDDDANIRTDKVPAGCYFEPAKMPHFLRFKGGYGMHAGFIPGYPASHGCVRLPDDMAKAFFEHASIGMPVIVK